MKGLVFDLFDELRGVEGRKNISKVLFSCLYLKEKKRDIKMLLLKEKKVLIEYIKEEVDMESDELTKRIFINYFNDLEDILNKMQDPSYRTILNKLQNITVDDMVDLTHFMYEMDKNEPYVPSIFINHLLVELAEVKEGNIVLDPSCGQGTILLESTKYQPKKLLGQEPLNEGAAQSTILLREKSNVEVNIYQENCLQDTLEEKVDRVITMHPFGAKYAVKHTEETNQKFVFGLPSKNQADWAYISNAITSLKDSGGKAVVLTTNGALFRGGMDEKIRKSILGFDFLEAVISLPNNVFVPMTGISTAILVFNTNKSDQLKNYVHFIKVDEKKLNITGRRESGLTEEIVDEVIKAYKNKETIEQFSKIVPISEVGTDWSVEQYITTQHYTVDGVDYVVDFEQLDQVNTVCLEDIVTIDRGFNLTQKSESNHGEYNIIKISDITEEGIDYPNLSYVNTSISGIENYVLKPNDLLLSIRGNIHKVVKFDSDKQNIIFNSNLVRVRIKHGYDPEWLLLYLKSPLAQILFTKYSKGTTVKQISMNDLKKMPVPVISIENQISLAASYNQKMNEVRRKMKKLELEKKEIQKMFNQEINTTNVLKEEISISE
ncbi:N-6 DNA methylase [Melissococcus sp. OM08-11BH]|uniref:N-6 DNA methylase n=1 Tax=Melissococcus sp. OM08-11BH TaxID=2293110 RepID=UPI000E5277CF|nr:N-6 DNA methylase [Melissococcus sp. OM08-11BH]RGI29681.1 hypothetical protein DXC12_07330 [Melissococcus sp. OM08-11BH]